jgi:four helix bundle protein
VFIALEVAIEAVRCCAPIAERIAMRNGPLANQLRRAAEAVALNLGEGRRRAGRDRTQCFRIAAGSAEEARTAIRVAEASGYLAADEVDAALAHLDRVLRFTWPLVRR